MPQPRPINQLWGLFCRKTKSWMHVCIGDDDDIPPDEDNDPLCNNKTMTVFLTRDAAYAAAAEIIEGSDYDPEVVRLI